MKSIFKADQQKRKARHHFNDDGLFRIQNCVTKKNRVLEFVRESEFYERVLLNFDLPFHQPLGFFDG